MSKKLLYIVSVLLVFGLSTVAFADPFTQDPGPDGIVSIEAENFDENVPEGDHFWEFNTEIPDFSGDGYMRAVPDGGGSGNPRLNYEVNFAKTGIHYVWVRGYSTSGTDDSCHVGLDNDETTSDRIQAGGGNGPWVWSINRRDNQGLAQVDVKSAGVHLLHVRMREDGWRFDKIVLTTNPDYRPTGFGPEESWRGPRLQAHHPQPQDGAMHPDTWVSLAWLSGETAVSHDVYFGESFNDVNDGTGDTFRGNQTEVFFVVGFPGFPYPDGLVPGTTYYWRIDEIEADGTTKYKGFIWSFSVPPQKAYDPDPTDGAESVALDVKLKWTAGFGSKLHTVYFGDSFDSVNDATVGFPQGATTYSPGPLRAAKTYYWRIDEFDGIKTHKGDVWSFTTEGAVGNPNPANGATGVETTSILTWNAGYLAASHEVYFGTDSDAVKNATKASPEYKGTQTLGNESFDPGALKLATTYYWRIDEVNNAQPDSPWTGNVWSFTTCNYLVMDDFESYNDIDPPDPASNRIFDNWIDGFGTTDNGALIGNDFPPYAEQTVIHGGSQSMPYRYDNNGKSSEATLTLTSMRDWTVDEVAELSIWFRGNPASVGSFTEGPVGTYTLTAGGADIWGTADQFHFAYKTLSGGGSIVAKVENVKNTNAWAKAGVMIRETLEPGSKFAAVYIMPTNADGSPTNGCRFQARTDTDGSATSDTSVASNEQMAITAPYWVKLERNVSGAFRAYYSSNGSSWTSMTWNPRSIIMASDVYVGLALTSHDVALTGEAKFSNVTTTGTVGQQWAHQDIGIASNDAQPIFMALSNTAGSPAIVYHDDPDASTIDAWTEWVIPLQKFADLGINLANIDRIAIGLGTKGNATAPGGSGKMYFDDIRLYRSRTAP